MTIDRGILLPKNSIRFPSDTDDGCVHRELHSAVSTHSTLASPTFSANDVKTFLSAPHPARCLATRREGLAFRDVYQRAGSGFCSVHRVGNLLHHRTHQAPSVFAENHDR